MTTRITATAETSSARDRWVVPGVVIGLTALCALIEASQNYIGAINFGKPVP